MNEILAGIYGTSGHEKIASPNGEGQLTLSDLALGIVVEELGEDAEIEKVASAHDQVLETLVEYDRAGRAVAQAEFSEMEKAAAEGNTEPLEAFFQDMLEADQEEGVEEKPEVNPTQQAILAEVQRRLSGQ
jgi:hypothetical protein